MGDTNSIKTVDGKPLTLLSGEILVTKEGWYDFTQLNEGGDGARYITNDAGRIVGVELASQPICSAINNLAMTLSLTLAPPLALKPLALHQKKLPCNSSNLKNV